jgi:quinol monooxygenase YgiN
MFMHIVLLKFNERADAEFHRKVQAFGERIRSECEDVLLFHVGENAADRSLGHTHAVISAFKSSEAHDRYQVSPAHVAMKAYLGPYTDQLVVYDGVVPRIQGDTTS